MPKPLCLDSILPNLATLSAMDMVTLRNALSNLLCRDFIALLPHEIAIQILAYLTPRDICRCAAVNRAWYVACGTASLWKVLLMKKHEGVEKVQERNIAQMMR
jgi:hypothetical protein